MKRYKSLVSVFMKSIQMSPAQDKRRKVMIVILSLFAIFGVLLPVTFFSGLVVNLMTQTLMLFDQAGLGIELMFYIISLFTVLFGINVIFNEFYFSNDIEYLLPLPLKPYQLAAAKFTAAFINENMMQFLLVLASVIGFGLATKMPLLSWLYSIVGIITMPIVPLVYCALISMFLMYFTKLIRNKEIIQKITVVIIFVILLVVIGSISTLQDLDMEHYVAALATGNQGFFKVMRIIFPTMRLFVSSFAYKNIYGLAAYIIVTALYIGVFLLVANFLYLDGVIGLSSAGSTKKQVSFAVLLKKVKKRTPFWALVGKEVKMLVRTPAYFINCVSMNFVWPVLVYALLKIQHFDLSVSKLTALYAAKDHATLLVFLLFVVGISLVMTGINSLGSNAISREGSQFQVMKFMPVNYFLQWHAKAFVSIAFSALGVLIYLIIGFVAIRVPVWQILLYTLLSLLAISLVSYTGILIDSIQPKLIWDDEMSVLRENYNTFFTMALTMILTGVLCGGGYLIYVMTKIHIVALELLFLAILAAGNGIVLYMTKKTGVRNIAEQEET